MNGLQFRDVFAAWTLFLSGVGTTLALTLAAIIGGTVVGVGVAVVQVYGPRWAGRFCTAYVEAIRNTPLLVQLFAVFFGLASLGLRLSGVASAVLCFVVYLGAYTAEIVRAGIEAVPRGQTEAGACLGLTRRQVLRHVVLKPALRAMFPALAGQFTFFLLSTSVVSQIAVEDLFHMGTIVQSQTYRDFEIYIVVGALYLVMSLGLRALLMSAYQVSFGHLR